MKHANHIELMAARNRAETLKHLAAVHVADAVISGAQAAEVAYWAESYRTAAEVFSEADRAVAAERNAFLASIEAGCC
jgi:hypothetical protein